MRLAKKIIICAVIYLLFMLALFPARIALSLAPIPKNITISGVQGTVWKGSINRISIDNRVLNHLNWDIDIGKLFLASFRLNLHVGNRASTTSGKAIVDLSFSSFSLSDVRFEAPSHFLLGDMRLPFKTKVSGALNLILPEFKQGQPWCESLKGKVFLDDIVINNQFGHYSLGNIALGLSCVKGNIQVVANEDGNKIGLKGKAVLAKNSRLELDAHIKKTDTQPADLAMALPLLGRPNNEGYYPLVYSGMIPKL